MKTTILKASKKTAESVALDLCSRKTPKGNQIFKRAEIENGFQITGRAKDGDVIVFKYVNDNGRQYFEYDERLLTF